MPDSLATGLRAQLLRPQRHRLLQGYPSMPQMRFAAPGMALSEGGRTLPDGFRTARGALETERAALAARLDAKRKLLADRVGLPHQTPHDRERFEQQIRPRLALEVEALAELLATPDPAQPPFVELDRSRDLIVGVIPHTQCAPRVEGCGFCTFPHDRADKHVRAWTVDAVASEISSILGRSPELAGRDVKALYFGGGTANLAKPEQIASLFASLAKHLQLADAEVTLEGVPSLFASWFHAALKMLDALPVRQRRISMGIQTFDRAATHAMGRSSFGDERAIQKLVARCKAMRITTSGDFLFNLPGQSASAMLDDVDRAIASGLDQICLYNLVLYEGLGTLWSKDPEKLAAMPTNDRACSSWLALRERLLGSGFTQTTLTNFERADVAASERSFLYERASFSPEKTDAIGFGPMSLSTFVDTKARRAIKLLRRKNLTGRPWSGDDLFYRYEGDDLRLLFITRSLAKGAFSKTTYRTFCGSNVADDFPAALRLLHAEGLIEQGDDSVALSPKGMFFSDAVVSTFIAEKQAAPRGAGVHTLEALARPTEVHDSYDGMG